MESLALSGIWESRASVSFYCVCLTFFYTDNKKDMIDGIQQVKFALFASAPGQHREVLFKRHLGSSFFSILYLAR